MPNLGLSELLVVFMILVLVFGASRLPAIGEGLGRTIRKFKRGLSSDEKIGVSEQESGPEGEHGEPRGGRAGAERAAKPAELPDRADRRPDQDLRRDAIDADIVDKS